MADEITPFGFTYGPATITRLSIVEGRGRTLEISTDHARIQIYISEAGRKIETFQLPPDQSSGKRTPVTVYLTKDGCCRMEKGMGAARPQFCESHGSRYLTQKEYERNVGTGADPAPGQAVVRVGARSSATQGGDVHATRPERGDETAGLQVAGADRGKSGVGPSKPRRKPLKRGGGFATSPVQRRATKGRACIVCGKDEAEAIIDPAHVTPRRMAPHCTCEKGTVPLCREHHEAYDRLGGGFDLLPYLMAHGLREETVHGFLEHGVSLREVMDVVTGVKWGPREMAA